MSLSLRPLTDPYQLEQQMGDYVYNQGIQAEGLQPSFCSNLVGLFRFRTENTGGSCVLHVNYDISTYCEVK